ncbi:MAG: HAMP domain-containing histidine kinase [Planctomycetota bacterium]|nr:MAG: HAMP domain-containing histidine kinase [Planctomycetota bacterium]
MIAQLNLRWKLALSNAIIVILAVAITGTIAARQLARDNIEQLTTTLQQKTSAINALCKPLIQEGRLEEVREQVRVLDRALNARVTIIAPDGSVLAESRRPYHELDNHLQRSEVQQALETGSGTALRYSSSVHYDLLYVAQHMRDSNGAMIALTRVAYPLLEVAQRRNALIGNLVVASIGGVTIAVLIGFWWAGRLSQPLRAMTAAANAFRQGDFSQRIVPVGNKQDVLGVLADTFNALAEALQQRLDIITDERNRLQAILTALDEGVVAVDTQQQVIMMNGAAADILDCDIPQVRCPLWECSRDPTVRETLDAVLADGVTRQQNYSCWSQRRSLQELSIELHCSTFADQQQHIVGAVLVLHDVSQRRRIEHMRRDFVANVSHELKTPLAAIRGLVETVLDDPDMPQAIRHRFIGKVSDQCLRLSSIVMDLLTLSRAEVGSNSCEWEIIDVGSLLRQSSHQLKTTAEDNAITLNNDLPQHPLPVRGDPELLHQAFDNLIDNAVKYTPQGGTVTVLARIEQQQLHCEIRDNGIGITAKHIERIWERFYRVDKARSREVGGTGLGLSIVRHVVQSHGGHISVSSTPGEGSTFTLSLPLVSQG